MTDQTALFVARWGPEGIGEMKLPKPTGQDDVEAENLGLRDQPLCGSVAQALAIARENGRHVARERIARHFEARAAHYDNIDKRSKASDCRAIAREIREVEV